jgi:hypothetical protein
MPDPDNRQAALHEAITFYSGTVASVLPGPGGHIPELLRIAGIFYQWLTMPVSLTVEIDPLTYQQDDPAGPGTPTIYTGGNVHMATLPDTFQVLLSVSEKDSKQQPVTADTITWTTDNPEAGVLNVSPDTYSATFVAGVPGVANVTLADAANPALTGTATITVQAGDAVSLVVTEGTPEPQPAP